MSDLSESINKSIKLGVAWLLKQQSKKTGGWHSDTYGAMRGGASITSLVLYAAAHLPKQHRESKAWQRGLSFLLPSIDKRSCIACPDGTLDYPTYSTALTLVASRPLGLKIEPAKRAKLINYLISAQLTEQNGFKPDQPDFGGWDLISGSGAKGITSGTNISVSFHAVEAIAGENHRSKADSLRSAASWCHRCQNLGVAEPTGDGGFFFHPDRRALGNKAQWSDEEFRKPRSYGTATSDGICLLLAAGAKQDDRRVRAGVNWLKEHHETEKVPGFDDAAEELGWDEGLKFYFFQGLSRVLHLLPKESREGQSDKLVEAIIGLQKDDGSWQNESARMREDDPLIASCFSLLALSNAAS